MTEPTDKGSMQHSRFQRSPNIVCYWDAGTLVCHNFATSSRVGGDALTLALLDYFSLWRSAAPLLASAPAHRKAIQRTLRKLVRASILHSSDRPLSSIERTMSQWSEWNPAAGFFHFSTKDTPFDTNVQRAQAFVAARLKGRRLPVDKKRRSLGIRLPSTSVEPAFVDVLLGRRTWRQFGSTPVSVRQLGTLLGLTFGAQDEIDLGAAGHAMLRTSPSAGACNPLEAYVAVRRVEGVPKGIYHYAPRDQALRPITGQRTVAFERYLPGQYWYSDASALVLITAVFERTSWKYPFARAYRTVLLEAGHFCQTFCLVATALKLAPFCSAALADSTIERALRIDGVTESVLYACGVGTPPHGVRSAPWPRARRIGE